jgi:hypothetical protein
LVTKSKDIFFDIMPFGCTTEMYIMALKIFKTTKVATNKEYK